MLRRSHAVGKVYTPRGESVCPAVSAGAAKEGFRGRGRGRVAVQAGDVLG